MAVTPDPSLNRARYGSRQGRRGALGHGAPRGRSRPPQQAALLKGRPHRSWSQRLVGTPPQPEFNPFPAAPAMMTTPTPAQSRPAFKFPCPASDPAGVGDDDGHRDTD